MVQIGDLTVDVAVQEQHEFSNEVTSHPVESGSDVADNTIVMPDSVTLTCLVSNTPLNGLLGVLNNDLPNPSNSPVDVARAYLLALRLSREPVTIIDSLGQWPSMVMEKLSIPRYAKTGDALQFTATFKKLVIVTNERTVVPVAIPRAQAQVKRGTKPSKSPPDPAIPKAVEDQRTGLHKVGNAFFGHNTIIDGGDTDGNLSP